jgi:uncharacterized membrane protein
MRLWSRNSMKTSTKVYVAGVFGIVLLVLGGVAIFDLSLRAAALLSFVGFVILDVWYVFSLRKTRRSEPSIDWRKEATFIFFCLVILGLIILERC